MTKFNALLFKCLPNAAHYGFFKIATSELAEAGEDVKDAVGRLETELNKWFAMETDNMQWYRKSAWTSAIVAANHRLDRALAGLTAQISAARHSAQPNVSAAGERLHIML
ncbi:MAG: hypothetical protein LBB73_07600, partial [Dysgonamonadaceae bacterium]|nr:hypothetical protein [Dysgonamonadaceae bacterium]